MLVHSYSSSKKENQSSKSKILSTLSCLATHAQALLDLFVLSLEELPLNKLSKLSLVNTLLSINISWLNFHRSYKLHLKMSRLGRIMSNKDCQSKTEPKDWEASLVRVFWKRFKIQKYSWLDLELSVASCLRTLQWLNWELERTMAVSWWQIQTIYKLPTWTDNFCSGKNISESQKVPLHQLRSARWILDSKATSKLDWIKYAKTPNKYSVTSSSRTKL